MPPFRFRAAAALELRERREALSKRALADARAALERAERTLAEGRSALDATLASGAAAAHDPGLSIWYRNWITRQHQELAKRRAMVADRRAAVDAAVARLHLAHRDVRVLERLRNRLQSAWALAERQKEQKELNWLGSMRYALRAGSHEEVT
jgi:flagellar export protein FliJ